MPGEESHSESTAENIPDNKGPGERLIAKRKQQGLDISDVCQRLNLTRGIINSLENNNFEGIAPIFVHGYLRKYARLLGLPESELIADYDALGIEAPPVISHAAARKIQTLKTGSPLPRLLLLWLFIFSVAGLAIWAGLYFYSGYLEEQPQADTDVEEVIEFVSPPVPSDSVVETIEEPVSPPGSEAEQAPATPAETEKSVSVNTKERSSNASVSIELTQDSWVELRDSQGNKLIYDLVRAGDGRKIEGKPPFTLVLGNAAGVSVIYNGQPIDMTRYRRQSGTATFVLGEIE